MWSIRCSLFPIDGSSPDSPLESSSPSLNHTSSLGPESCWNQTPQHQIGGGRKLFRTILKHGKFLPATVPNSEREPAHQTSCLSKVSSFYIYFPLSCTRSEGRTYVHGPHMEVGGQLLEVCSLLLVDGLQGLNTGHWQPC